MYSTALIYIIFLKMVASEQPAQVQGNTLRTANAATEDKGWHLTQIRSPQLPPVYVLLEGHASARTVTRTKYKGKSGSWLPGARQASVAASAAVQLAISQPKFKVKFHQNQVQRVTSWIIAIRMI